MVKKTCLTVEAQEQAWEERKKVAHVPIYTSRWVYCPIPNKAVVGMSAFSVNDKKDFEDCTKCNYYGGIFIAEGSVICKYPSFSDVMTGHAS